MNPIQGPSYGLIQPPDLSEIGKPVTGTGAFKNLLVEGLNQVNEMQLNADRAIEMLSTGADVNPAEVLTAVQKADMAFRMMLQVRNKLVQAYQEIKDIRI